MTIGRAWIVLLSLAARAAAGEIDPVAPSVVALPDGAGGIGFDDLGFSPLLHRVLAPAGGTGRLALIDPETRAVAVVGGFGASSGFGGGHGEGTTSADEGGGFVFASDRGRKRVVVIDPKRMAIVGGAALAGNPDYVRWVEATREVWVTEPRAQQIEVFAIGAGAVPAPVAVAKIAVEGGPESLVVDGRRGRAYSHLWKGRTVAIDLKTRALVTSWENGCQGSRGIALDGARGFLFAGCDEGRATVLDLAHDGKILGALSDGKGVDVIAYDAGRRHLYLPGAESATMAILAVSDGGALRLVSRVRTAPDAHCVTADDRGGVWVCDPKHGRLLRFDDGAR